MELLDRLGGLGSDLVLDGQGAKDAAVDDDVEHGLAVLTPGLGLGDGCEAEIYKQAWSTDSHRSTVHRRSCTAPGKREATVALTIADWWLGFREETTAIRN